MSVGRVLLYVFRDGFAGVPGDQALDLLNDPLAGRKRALMEMFRIRFPAILRVHPRESGECVEADHPPCVVVRFVDRREMKPTDQPSTSEHAAFNDAAVGGQRELEQFVLHKKPGDILTPDVAGKGLQALRNWKLRGVKCIAQFVEQTAFLGTILLQMVAKLFQCLAHTLVTGAFW